LSSCCRPGDEFDIGFQPSRKARNDQKSTKTRRFSPGRTYPGKIVSSMYDGRLERQQFRQIRVLFGDNPSLSRLDPESRRDPSAEPNASGRCEVGASAVAGFSTQLKCGVGSATCRHSKPSAKAV
jgi:hypothetical protein